MNILQTFSLKTFLVFTIINLIYVIGNCMKTILQVKGSKSQSCITSALVYSFYMIVLKQVAQVDYFTSMMGTFVSNLLGDYLGRLIVEYVIKRPITSWKLTLKDGIDDKIRQLITYLQENNLGCHWVIAHNFENTYYKFTIYTKNKAEDENLKHLLKYLEIEHYHIEKY